MKGGYQRAPGWGISETLLARSPALSWREIAGLTAVGQGLIAWIQPIRSCYVFFHFLPLSSTSPSNTQRSRLRKQYKLNNQPHQGLFSVHPGVPGSPLSLLRCLHLPLSVKNAPLPHSHLPLFTVSDLPSSFKPHLKYPSSWKLRSHVLC